MLWFQCFPAIPMSHDNKQIAISIDLKNTIAINAPVNAQLPLVVTVKGDTEQATLSE